MKTTDIGQMAAAIIIFASQLSAQMTEAELIAIIDQRLNDSGLRISAPVGTIIASILTPQQFRIANNDCEILQDADPYRGCKWMPADGQLAPRNSIYDKLFRQGANRVAVVDLRGVFIRGLNTFDPSAAPVDVRQANPNPLREDGTQLEAGDFQEDSTVEHSHTLGFRAVGGVGHQPGTSGGIDYQGIKSTTETLADGEAETRPKSVSVYYYVRIN